MRADDEAWERVRSVLAENWEFPVVIHERLTGGRNASTWRVSGPAGTAVAKLVEPGDASPAQFEASLRVAAALDRPDLPTAPPWPSRDGHNAVPIGAGRLALLPWLRGRPLSGTSAADCDRMGTVLARLHKRTAGMVVPGTIPRWPWSWLSLDTLGLMPLDRGDAGLVDRAARAAAGPYSLGVVHGDPAPYHFLAVGATVGVIDWASVMQGPPGYDLGVLALMTERAGAGPDQIRRLIASYRDTADRSTVASEAVDAAGLARMRALRLAAEIVYFTSRLRQPAGASTDVGSDLPGLVRARTALRKFDREAAGGVPA